MKRELAGGLWLKYCFLALPGRARLLIKNWSSSCVALRFCLAEEFITSATHHVVCLVFFMSLHPSVTRTPLSLINSEMQTNKYSRGMRKEEKDEEGGWNKNTPPQGLLSMEYKTFDHRHENQMLFILIFPLVIGSSYSSLFFDIITSLQVFLVFPFLLLIEEICPISYQSIDWLLHS